MEYQQIVQVYEEAQKRYEIARKELFKSSDGFKYMVTISSYGISRTREELNSTVVQEILYSYNGDNGHVDVLTTNPNHELDAGNDNSVTVVTLESWYKRG